MNTVASEEKSLTISNPNGNIIVIGYGGGGVGGVGPGITGTISGKGNIYLNNYHDESIVNIGNFVITIETLRKIVDDYCSKPLLVKGIPNIPEPNYDNIQLPEIIKS